MYVVHNYRRSQSDPKHFGWASNGGSSDVGASVRRLKTLMGMREGGASDPAEVRAVQQSRYGLGDRRSLEQMIAFTGIDTINRKILFNG